MIRVTLKGLAGRKLRALLTALAVVIGVAMVSGTYVLTDTFKQAFDGIFTESYADTDAVITGKQLVDFSSSGRATVPASVLQKVKELPSVDAAAGSISDLQNNSNPAKIIGRDGKAIGASNNPTFGMGVDPAQVRFTPLRLTSGDWAKGPHDVVIDAGTADKHHYAVGDTIRIATLGPIKPYTVTGIASFGSVDSLGGATIAAFDLPTAQAEFHKQGAFDAIDVAAKDGVSASALVKQIKPLVPASGVVKSGDAQAVADAKDTNEGLKFITYILLGFGGVALFVGAFVILNTLSITVAQRAREFATLRTLGASRKQVLRSVVLEGFVIGVLASVVGLFAGLGIGKGMNALFVAFGIDLPQVGTVLATRTIIVSLLLGTVVTTIASLVPAVRATRVPPITAVREGSLQAASGRRRKPPRAGYATIAVALVLIGVALFASGLAAGLVALLLGVGVLALFVGIAMISPRLVRPLARVVGWPARRAGGPAGRLASENAMRNPGRTAATAAALMIGLALVTVVAVLGAGLRDSVENAVGKQVTADYVVTSENGFDPFTAEAGDAVAGAAGVRAASSVRSDQGLASGAQVSVTGVDPGTIGHFYKFDWTHGSDASVAALDGDGALVQKSFAEDHHLVVGGRVPVVTAGGKKLQLIVRGIYDPPDMDPLLGQVAIGQSTFDATFPRPRNLFTFADTGGAAPPALTAAVASFPDVKLHTTDEFATSRTEDFQSILNLLYVLLGFSVVVSLFGMVNTLVLAVFERTRELGMLRAVGMTRRQARRMIRHESVITALIGAAMGIPLGIVLSALVTKALSQYGVGLSIPIANLAAFAVVAIVAGVLAAVLPARRASRLNVLDALQYE